MKHSGKTIYFPPALLKKLQRQAKSESRPLSNLVVMLVLEALK